MLRNMNNPVYNNDYLINDNNYHTELMFIEITMKTCIEMF